MPDLQVILAGTGLDNDNRGVEALGRSVVRSLADDRRVTGLSILDDGWGVRRDPDSTQPGMRAERVGARVSRRWYRPESWARIRLAQFLGGARNPVAQRIAQAHAVLDLSAGDSFTDLYGRKRFDLIAAPKLAAIRAKRPLILLPQTYGPFETDYARAGAERIVRNAALAYSRDSWSHDQLIRLAGRDADETRLREGVDVAFALPEERPTDSSADAIERHAEAVVVGVNVSGLLFGKSRQSRFGLAGDYAGTMRAIVKALIAEGAHVMFVAHVNGSPEEDDLHAAQTLTHSLTPTEQEQVYIAPSELRASEMKWCISRTDWFIGSRMHATIAALSSMTPAFGYAYSDKTRGVFATCSMSDNVADARRIAGDEVVDLALHSFRNRGRTRDLLAKSAPPVIHRARQQLFNILDDVSTWSSEPSAAGTIVR